MERISIIVPIYKVEKFLDNCIDSIVNQTYKNLEIILVDDGSPDNCPFICEKWAKKDNRIKVIHKKNGGVASARNIGLKNVSGKYISFIDPDDFVNNLYIEKLYNNLIDNDADISIVSYQKINGTDIYNTKKRNNEENVKVLNSEEAISIMSSYSKFGVELWNKLFKRELFEKIEFPNVKIGEDWFIIYDIFVNAQKMVLSDYVGYYYRINKKGLSRNKTVSLDCINASKHALDLITVKYPNLRPNCVTIYINENLSVYNKMCIYHIQDKKLKEEIINIVSTHKKEINYGILNSKKKIQFTLFLKFRTIYNFLLKIYALLRRK